ncbi:hypothetical protein HKX48_006279 [Thoreauomyces humboldtii]|nr:hypothetical protein HKX48_006279 [Thoreauomyces humboldtii]
MTALWAKGDDVETLMRDPKRRKVIPDLPELISQLDEQLDDAGALTGGIEAEYALSADMRYSWRLYRTAVRHHLYLYHGTRHGEMQVESEAPGKSLLMEWRKDRRRQEIAAAGGPGTPAPEEPSDDVPLDGGVADTEGLEAVISDATVPADSTEAASKIAGQEADAAESDADRIKNAFRAGVLSRMKSGDSSKESTSPKTAAIQISESTPGTLPVTIPTSVEKGELGEIPYLLRSYPALPPACPPFCSTRSHSTHNTSTFVAPASAVTYVSTLLRKSDYENYVASLFAPSPARHAVWAVRAFNVETAMIRENVTKPEIGRARIAWWRDAVEKLFKGHPPNHPVVLLLAEALETRPLSKSWFSRILSEREANLQDPQYGTIADLERYAENTASALLYLQLEAMGVQDPQADHAASHVGKAVGIATILRGTPFNVEEKRLYLPSEVLAKHSVASETVFRSGPSSALEEAVFEVATAANDHLITARSFLKDSPPAAFPALLAAVPAELYLQALEKANFNVFDPNLGKRSWKLPYRLWSAARGRTI